MAGSTVSTFGDHKLKLLTDNDYRRRMGLSPLVAKTEPDSAARIPETGEPVLEVDPQLQRQIDDWKEQRKDVKRRTDQLTVLIDQAEAELAEQYAKAGVNTLTLDGRKATLHSTLRLRKRRDDITTAQVVSALRADGLFELIQPAGYNANTLAAWARDLEANGEPLPPHVAKLLEGWETHTFTFTTPRPTRARKRQAGARSSILDGGASTE